MKIRVVLVLLLLLIAFSLQREFSYPQTWDNVNLGMSRTELVQTLGEPGQVWQAKGLMMWYKSGLLTTYELEISPGVDSATTIAIERRIGTATHFDRKVIRFERQD